MESHGVILQWIHFGVSHGVRFETLWELNEEGGMLEQCLLRSLFAMCAAITPVWGLRALHKPGREHLLQAPSCQAIFLTFYGLQRLPSVIIFTIPLVIDHQRLSMACCHLISLKHEDRSAICSRTGFLFCSMFCHFSFVEIDIIVDKWILG